MTDDVQRLPDQLREAPIDVEALIAATSAPRRTVTLCLKGELVAAYEELAEQLETAPREATSMGEPSPASLIAQRMEELRQEMLAFKVGFQLRALAPLEWANFRAGIPGEDRLKGLSPEERAEVEFTWDCRAIFLCLVKPEMNEDQVRRLCERLSTAQRNTLFSAALAANTGKADVPFSYAASALNQQNGET